MKVWVTDDSNYFGMNIMIRETVRDVIPPDAMRVKLKPLFSKWHYTPNVVPRDNVHETEEAARAFYEKRRAHKIESLRQQIQEWESKKIEVVEE